MGRRKKCRGEIAGVGGAWDRLSCEGGNTDSGTEASKRSHMTREPVKRSHITIEPVKRSQMTKESVKRSQMTESRCQECR